ncbi:helix-turn-helix domain-containing protein [Streptomyces sp. NPDC051133]|uniref:PucR family transcriptional regulator n=1 Tax=Streptomyces sp. NPDC051133 TaxID=3155521 RepID=UPI003436CF2E
MHEAIVPRFSSYENLEKARGADLLDELHQATALVVDWGLKGEPIPEPQIELWRTMGRERGTFMIPLSDVRAAVTTAHTAGLREVYSITDGDMNGRMLEFAGCVAQEHPRLLAAEELACAATLRENGETKQARSMLVNRLIEGEPAAFAADAAGVTLPKGYLVVVCRQKNPGRQPSATTGSLIERTLEALPGALWQGNLISTRLLLLLPTEEDATTARAASTNLIPALSEIVGQSLHTAEAYASTLDSVPQAAQEVLQAITLVAAMPDAQNRPYRIEELLVELAISRQPTVQHRLADLLIPLQQGTDLVQTLDALFACHLDREETARALYIHRRTLSYRIRRIQDLTGINPTTAHGIQLLRTALIATRLHPAPGKAQVESPPGDGTEKSAAAS